MMLINECVNGCSLFEDNSHHLLDVCTIDAQGACTGQACEPVCPWATAGSMPVLTEGPYRAQSGTQNGALVLQGRGMWEHTGKYTFTEPRWHSTLTHVQQTRHSHHPRHPAPCTAHAEHRITRTAPVRNTHHTTAHRTHPLHPQDTHTKRTPHTRLQAWTPRLREVKRLPQVHTDRKGQRQRLKGHRFSTAAPGGLQSKDSPLCVVIAMAAWAREGHQRAA